MRNIKKLLLKCKRFSKNNGFTLVELLIYMGLLTVILLVFTQIFASILDNELTSKNTSNVVSDGRYIYSRFIYDVNRADSISVPPTLGSTSANMTFVANSNTYSYSLSNNNLLFTDSSGSDNLNGYGTTISNLSFRRIGNLNGKPTIKISFKVTGIIPHSGNYESQTFDTTAGLR